MKKTQRRRAIRRSGPGAFWGRARFGRRVAAALAAVGLVAVSPARGETVADAELIQSAGFFAIEGGLYLGLGSLEEVVASVEDRSGDPAAPDPAVDDRISRGTCARIEDPAAGLYEVACGGIVPQYGLLWDAAWLQGTLESLVYQTGNPEPIAAGTVEVDIFWEASGPIEGLAFDMREGDLTPPPDTQACVRFEAYAYTFRSAAAQGLIGTYFGAIELERAGGSFLRFAASAALLSIDSEDCFV